MILLRSALLSLSCIALLAACSGAKERLGLTRRTPDAFAVVTRAPLSMPPDYSLRPPVPGAPRPQEEPVAETAAKTLVGSKRTGPGGASKAERLLLEQSQALDADPSIRATVNAETADIIEEDTPTARKLLGLSNPTNAPAPVINPVEETKRIQAQKVKKSEIPSQRR